MRTFISAFITSSLKVFAVAVYAAWGLKILLDPDDPNILFNLLALVLSIFGVWVLASRASDWIERTLDGGKPNAVDG